MITPIEYHRSLFFFFLNNRYDIDFRQIGIMLLRNCRSLRAKVVLNFASGSRNRLFAFDIS